MKNEQVLIGGAHKVPANGIPRNVVKMMADFPVKELFDEKSCDSITVAKIKNWYKDKFGEFLIEPISKYNNCTVKDMIGEVLYKKIKSPTANHTIRVEATIILLQGGFQPQQLREFYSQLGWQDYNANMTAEMIQTLYSKYGKKL